MTIAAEWSQSRVVLTISDDGPGFPPDVLMRAGEPYLSRGGATLEFSNRAAPASGASIRIVWPRDIFEADLPALGGTKPEASALHELS